MRAILPVSPWYQGKSLRATLGRWGNLQRLMDLGEESNVENKDENRPISGESASEKHERAPPAQQPDRQEFLNFGEGCRRRLAIGGANWLEIILPRPFCVWTQIATTALSPMDYEHTIMYSFKSVAPLCQAFAAGRVSGSWRRRIYRDEPYPDPKSYIGYCNCPCNTTQNQYYSDYARMNSSRRPSVIFETSIYLACSTVR